jgi:hypothetical protein
MLRRFGAYFLIFFGLFILLGLLIGKSSGILATALTFLFFVAVPMAAGIQLLRGDRKAKERAAAESKQLLRASHEKEILRLAEQKGGVLTVSQIVKETSMDASEAEAALHELIVKRLADLRTAADGQAIYEFPEFADIQEFEKRRIQSDLLRE